MRELTQEYLKTVLHYDPDTGLFRWATPRRKVRVGDLAGKANKAGYLIITIDQRAYRAHRLAWFYMTGTWPENDVDHKDTVRHHNWWTNLRPATRTQNNANARRTKTNTTGFKGASVCGQTKLIRAQIRINKQRVHLGYFRTAEEAHAAYMKKAHEVHGEFANDGSSVDIAA